MQRTMVQSELAMGTMVTLTVVTDASSRATEERMLSAWQAIRDVERACSRFDAKSELSQLTHRVGDSVRVSPLLFSALHFALEMAMATDGVFDPTVGQTLEQLGFTTHYLTGQDVRLQRDSHVESLGENACQPSGLAGSMDEGRPFGGMCAFIDASDASDASVDCATYRDVELDHEAQSVRLHKPLLLDLGAVAKGLAVDLALHELKSFPGVLVNAGGDIAALGQNACRKPWRVGVRNPFDPAGEPLFTVQLHDESICTSGTYERRSPLHPRGHHLVHGHRRECCSEVVSSTVLSPYCMMSDALSTAALLLGMSDGTRLLAEQDIPGVLVSETGSLQWTEAMKERIEHGCAVSATDRQKNDR